MITISTERGHSGIRTVLLLALTLAFFSLSAHAQTLGTVSYQGLLKQGSTLVNGTVTLTVTYYYTGTGVEALSETFNNVLVTNGVFNVELGSRVGGLATAVDFTRPIELGISVNGSTELVPRIRVTAVPYALTAHTLDGLLASATPADNRIFPMPMENGRIASSLLPPEVTINGLANVNGNFEIAAGNNITITRDLTNSRLLISGTSGNITGIAVGRGLLGGGNTGLVSIGLDPGNIPGTWLTPQSLTGRQLDPNIAGLGLVQDVHGCLDLSVNLAQFEVADDILHLRTDVPVIGTTGMFNALNVTGDVVLSTLPNASTSIAGPLYTLRGIDAGDQPITRLAEPVNPLDAANMQYVDTRDIMNRVMDGDIVGQTTNSMLNPTSEGLGDRLVEAINFGGGVGIHPTRIDLPDGEILVGNGGTSQNVTMSGDATMDNMGVVTVNHAATAVDFTGTLGGDVNGLQGSTQIGSLQGTPVAAQGPVDGQVLMYEAASNTWKPMTAVPSGSVSLRASGFFTSTLSTTVNNALVTPNSLIVATVIADGNSNLSDHYIVYISNIGAGSFDVNLVQSSSAFSNGEGATVHYAIFNPPVIIN